MAGNRSLGTLTVDLITKIGGFKAGMDEAARKAKASADEISDKWAGIGSKIGAGAGIAFGAIATGAGIAAVSIKNVIDEMDNISKAALRSGVSTEVFSALAYAGNLADVSIETLQGTFGKLTKNMAAAAEGSKAQAEAFASVGISVLDVEGNLRSSSDVLLEFADVWKREAGSPEAMAVGFKIFGKSFQDLIPLLNGGAEALRDAMKEAEEFGQVTSTEAGQAAEAFNDNLTRLQTGVNGVWKAIAVELLPDLVQMSNDVVDASKNTKLMSEVATATRDALDLLRIAVSAVAIVWTVFTSQVKIAASAAYSFISIALALNKVIANLNIAGVVSGNLKAAAVEAKQVFVNSMDSFKREAAAAGKEAGESLAQSIKNIDDIWSGKSRIAADAEAAEAAAARSLKIKQEAEEEDEKTAAKLREQQQTLQAQAKTRAELVGNTSRLFELETQIRNGLVKGDEAHLNALRESAALEDRNTASLKAQEEAKRSAEKAAREGAAASKKAAGEAKKAAAEAEREAKKREQEAERLKERYDNQVLALERSIYMIGKEGEAAAMAWEISKGEFKDYSEQQKQHLMLLAQNVDAAQKAFDVQKKARDEAAKKLEEEADRQKEANRAYKEYLDDVKFNLSLLGKSADEQERLNALKQLGIDADSEAGKVLTETLKIYQEQRKAVEDQVAAMDELRSGFSNALSEWVSGTKSFKDAFKDALDQVHKRIIQLISDRWTEQLFGSFGSNEPGKAGKGPVGFFGRLFGVKDPKELEGQMDALRTGEDGKEVLPYDPANIEALRAEAQRMTDGVIAVHQQAADAMAGAVGGNANAATANNQAVADSAIGNIQVTADGALESVKETGEHAQQSMDTAVQGAGSAMEGEGAGFLGRIKGMFSGIFGEGGGGFMGLFSNIFSNLGNFLTKTINSVFSSSPTGGGGAGLFSTFASMFAGGRANGGPVSAGKLYRVNENMPEMLSIGNQDFLMMGNQNGRVSNAASGGMQQVNNFVIHGRIDRRTESQIAQDVGQRTQRAINRNA